MRVVHSGDGVGVGKSVVEPGREVVSKNVLGFCFFLFLTPFSPPFILLFIGEVSSKPKCGVVILPFFLFFNFPSFCFSMLVFFFCVVFF